MFGVLVLSRKNKVDDTSRKFYILSFIVDITSRNKHGLGYNYNSLFIRNIDVSPCNPFIPLLLSNRINTLSQLITWYDKV